MTMACGKSPPVSSFCGTMMHKPRAHLCRRYVIQPLLGFSRVDVNVVDGRDSPKDNLWLIVFFFSRRHPLSHPLILSNAHT
jgi:hypothetical protein